MKKHKIIISFLLLIFLLSIASTLCYAEVTFSKLETLETIQPFKNYQNWSITAEYEGTKYSIPNFRAEDWEALLSYLTPDSLALVDDGQAAQDFTSIKLPQKLKITAIPDYGLSREFHLDETSICILYIDTFHDTLDWGFFQFKDKNTFSEVFSLIEPYAEKEANNRAEYEEKYIQNIYNFKQVYQASFDCTIYSSPTEFGIASYTTTPESTNLQYIAYIDLGGGNIMNSVAYSSQEQNSICWNFGPILVTDFKNQKFYIDKETSPATANDFECRFQFELTEDRQIRNVFVTFNDGTRSFQKQIDMDTFTATGLLPEVGNFHFSHENNADVFSHAIDEKEPTQKPEEAKEQTKTETSEKPAEQKAEEKESETEDEIKETQEQKEKAEDSAQTEENITLPEQSKPNLKNPNPDTIAVFLDGVQLEFAQEPIISNDRCMVPMRKIFESLGATVEWEQAEKRVFATKGEKQINLQIGSFVLNKGQDETVLLDAMPMLVNNHTLVPIRAVAESLDANVEWNASEKIVTIETK